MVDAAASTLTASQGSSAANDSDTERSFRPGHMSAIEAITKSEEAALRHKFEEARDIQIAARQGTACQFYFIKASKIRDHGEHERLPPLTELVSTRGDWLVRKYLTLAEACLGR